MQFEPIVRKTDNEALEALTSLIAQGQALGSIRPELSPTTTASLLLAVVDGLTVRALAHPDPSVLLTELDQFLNVALTPDDVQ